MASNRQFKHPIQPSTVSNNKTLEVITVDDLLSTVKPDSGVVQTRWHGLDIFIRKYIPLIDVTNLINCVFDRCWDGEVMRRELMDFELRLAVVVFYSNVSMPDDPELCSEILYCTDLYDTIRGCIQDGQIRSIEETLKSYLNK